MKNVGGRERTLRAVFGSCVVIVDFLASVQIEILFLLVGLWGVLTSAFGYCPFNGLLNRNTCTIDVQPSQPRTPFLALNYPQLQGSSTV
ncbi:MAG: DUF2892 domain-containing protein [Candidatus Thermoplasmatota archaeon]|nr:DUF2892 domain-containing protein [Candidatus Thermoplasmatota archaeon]